MGGYPSAQFIGADELRVLEPVPEATRRREIGIRERHRPDALYGAVVAAALLDDLRLHRRLEAGAVRERSVSQLHVVVLLAPELDVEAEERKRILGIAHADAPTASSD
jgi:hypothetical protein